MKTEQGKLKKIKTGYLVTLPSKKGMANHQIPQHAQRFGKDDAANGLEVVVDLDGKNNIVKVTIPGKPEVAPPSVPTGQRGAGGPNRPGHGGAHGRPGRGPDRAASGPSRPQAQLAAVAKLPKASPRVFGSDFHNPYTFLPFPEKSPKRCESTPLTADKLPEGRDRLTGILELEITTQSPLLTCHPRPLDEAAEHKTYNVLRIGPDVIVPAAGIRGSLRTLLTVLTGGTLGYLNRDAYLCQGRDANLGPRRLSSPPGTPLQVFLAEVVRPGTAHRNGVVRLGETRLVRLDSLERCYGQGGLPRPQRPGTLG